MNLTNVISAVLLVCMGVLAIAGTVWVVQWMF